MADHETHPAEGSREASSHAARRRGTVPWGGPSVLALRLIVAGAFAATSLWLGLALHRSVAAAHAALPGLMAAAHSGRAVDSVALDLPARPPGAAAYLPISGLVGLFDAAYDGALNRVHPAASVLVATFILLSLLVRRAFCGWVCPIGLASEVLAIPVRWLRRGRDLRLPPWLDVVARAPKYLLLAFFVWSIAAMGSAGTRAFVESEYNRLADVRMLVYFTDPSSTTLYAVGGLVVASLLVRGAWCRYLCPYGALLGLAGWLSPTAIRRDPSRCVSCGRCERACWARLPVATSARVASPECSACLDCVASCPRPGCLSVSFVRSKVPPTVVAAAVVAIVAGAVVVARLAGAWHSDVDGLEWVVAVARLRLAGH